MKNKLYRRVCPVCGKVEWVRKELLHKKCKSCAVKEAKKNISLETRRKMSEAKKGFIPWNKGKKMTKEYRKKLSEAHKGKQTWASFHREKLREKWRKNNPMKNPDIVKKRSGEFHHNWKRGITPERTKWETFQEGKKWRLAVFQRDNFICRRCGKRGVELNAHHIFNWAENKELRNDINNGITLCKECHTEFHKKYGFRNNNLKQITEFVGDKQMKDRILKNEVGGINER